ncbi:EF-P 5-aminopentanol modification-associated protein YfmF [Macrococcus equipercicus]|uniref:Insulinase family protein n=1 Tax=Macrococcus equipercicus TaxID=69967 RepID=A0A9Q9F3U5_9STAP|nr:pitrilysin family protein [Macrococcus equipercicus]KAA1036982.1 insulinase family protein [Macrococcus equipercicus]UTH14699.1 insulinase family protein [Macrococcus equipercicus]
MIPVHINEEHKFKTISIVIKFKAPINKDTVTERALLSKLMTKVTARYPSEQQLHDVVAENYGANLFSYVTKQKTAHVLTIGIDIINDKYLSRPENLFVQALELLEEVIQRPLLEGEAFHPGKVAVEKQLMQARFDSIKDNKTQYGYQQLMQEMFKGHDYRFPSYGIEEELAAVTPGSIYKAYEAMLHHDEKEIFVIGDVDSDEVTRDVRRYLALPQGTAVLEDLNIGRQDVPHYVTEQTDTTQAKINIGMTADITYGTRDYFSFVVFNQIFGGDVTSLLFMNVREKLSLAYQIHSQIDARLGYLYVIAGVNKETRELAVNTILEQLDMIKAGQFSEELIHTAKTMLVTHKKETFDRPKGWIEATYAKGFDDIKLTTEEWIAGINEVTYENVIHVAQHVHVHTIYCLTNEVKA